MGCDAFTSNTVKTRLSLPLNGTVFSTTRNVSSEKPFPEVGSTMQNELGIAYASSRIIAVTDGPDRSKGILTITHAIIPNEAEQLESNWERTMVAVGIGQMKGVVSTFIIPSEDYNDATPALNSAMPVVTGGAFDGAGYVLYDRELVKSGMSLEPVFRVEKRTYIKKQEFLQNDFDEALSGNLQTIQTLYHADENIPGVIPTITAAALFSTPTHAYWGIQSNGWEREGKQLTPDWYVIIARQVIPTEFLAVVGPPSNPGGRSYETTETYQWPAVLGSIQVDSWPRVAGGSDMYAYPVWYRNAFHGECKATVTDTWSKNHPDVSAPTNLNTTPIVFSTPFFGLSIESCLHGQYNYTISSGTGHPIYEYAGGTFGVVATGPVESDNVPVANDWPLTITAQDSVVPFRGGYMRHTVVINRPA